MERPRRRLPDWLRKADKLLLLGLMTITFCAACLSTPEPVVAVPTMIAPSTPVPTSIDADLAIPTLNMPSLPPSTPDLQAESALSVDNLVNTDEACMGVREATDNTIRVTLLRGTDNGQNVDVLICAADSLKGWNAVIAHLLGDDLQYVEEVSLPIPEDGLMMVTVFGETNFNAMQVIMRTGLGADMFNQFPNDQNCPKPGDGKYEFDSKGNPFYISKCEEKSGGESGYEFDRRMIRGFMGNDYLYLSRSDFLSLFASNFLV